MSSLPQSLGATQCRREIEQAKTLGPVGQKKNKTWRERGCGPEKAARSGRQGPTWGSRKGDLLQLLPKGLSPGPQPPARAGMEAPAAGAAGQMPGPGGEGGPREKWGVGMGAWLYGCQLPGMASPLLPPETPSHTQALSPTLEALYSQQVQLTFAEMRVTHQLVGEYSLALSAARDQVL